jgi:hypothetical protein
MAHSALSVIDVYEQLLSAPDDKTRARIIATAFERLEDRYPELKDLATATGVRETELRLLKDIELIRQDTQQIRADIHAMEQKIGKEIEQIRADMHKFEQQIRADMQQTELRLQKEMAEIHLKIETTRNEVNLNIANTSRKQVQWMVALFFTFAFTLIAAMFGVSLL